MKSKIILLAVVLLIPSFIKAQVSKTFDIETEKAELIFNLCSVTSMMGAAVDKFDPYLLIFTLPASENYDKMIAHFDEKLKTKLNSELVKEFEEIKLNIDKIFEMNNNKQDELVYRNLKVYQMLVDNKIKRFIKQLMKEE